jgi:hypothetical protein
MRSTTGTASHDRHRVLAVALLALTCAVALAACGSSSNSSSGSGLKGRAAMLQFASCMRAHGVPNFPDPSPGGGLHIDQSSGINPSSPAFQSAQNTCSKLLPGGGPGRGPVSEARKQQMLRLAQCMRAHGVSAFPDPTSGPPSSPSPGSGGGLGFGTPGAFLSVPQSLINSPAFQTAATACGFPVPGRGLGPKATAPTG